MNKNKERAYNPEWDGALRASFPLYPGVVTFECRICGVYSQFDTSDKTPPPHEIPQCDEGHEMTLYAITFTRRRPQWWNKHNLDFDHFNCTVYGWDMTGAVRD